MRLSASFLLAVLLVSGGAVPAPLAAEPIKFVQGIQSMRELGPELRKIRTRMFDDATKVSYRSLQRLADAGDGLAAMLIGRRILDEANPALNASAVHYFALAAYNGRAAAIQPLATLLGQIGTTLSPALLSQAQQALEVQADHHQPLAIEALVRFYGSEPIFGADPTRVEAYLAKLGEIGRVEAVLDLGVSAMAAGATSDAIRYLEAAALSADLRTRVTAENLLRQLRAPTVPAEEAP